jgi:hypothetical protein
LSLWTTNGKVLDFSIKNTDFTPFKNGAIWIKMILIL